MKAIIPAAGHGTRFLPVTRVIPKEMLPIGAKPALELIVDEAKSAGADEIVMVISKARNLSANILRTIRRFDSSTSRSKRGWAMRFCRRGRRSMPDRC